MENPEDDDSDLKPKNDPNENFPFEDFLKKGNYLNVGKKRCQGDGGGVEGAIRDLIDEEDLLFKDYKKQRISDE